MERRDKERVAVSLIILALMMAMLVITANCAFAEDSASIFSVSVPTCLPVEIDEFGNVTTAGNLKIINNAESPIAVNSITVQTENGWELCDMSEDFRSQKAGTKKFALSFCGKTVPGDGNADISGIPALEGYEEFTIFYDASFPTRIEKTDGEVIGQCLFTVGYETGRLKGLKIVSMPDKTVYCPGESFDSAGMTVAACYYGQEDRIIDSWYIENGNGLSEGQTSVTVSAEDRGIKKSASVPIEVKKSVSSVMIVSYPYKKSYFAGEPADITGLSIEAVYSDGSRAPVTNYDVSPKTVGAGTKKLDISYEIDGSEGTLDFAVDVKRTLVSLSITAMPRTSYISGECFDPSGAAVIANFSGGYSENVTGKVRWSRGEMDTSVNSVQCSYSENGIEKSASIAVSVIERHLSGLAVSSPPAKTQYFEGETFDASGVEVTANYSDGSTSDVTGSVSWNKGILGLSDTGATCTYSDGGITKSASVALTVRAVAFEYIEITSLPYKTLYAAGESFNPEGAAAQAVYSNGHTEDITGRMVWSRGTLSQSDTSVTGSCTLGSVTKSADVPVSVSGALSYIYCAVMPAKTSYRTGESFDRTGMVITAVYSNGYERNVSSYTTSFDGAAFSFVTPPSTKQYYVTYRDRNFICDIAVEVGVDEDDLRLWNHFGTAQCIFGTGYKILITDPKLDEAVTCTENSVNVEVYYTENGGTASCAVPVKVVKG